MPLLTAAALPALVLLAINGEAVQTWRTYNAIHLQDDQLMTQYGVLVREATAESAVIAVTWAGAIPYFSHRPSLDLLGKSDRFIATSPPKELAEPFRPGHNKWDYAYSIGQLKPDVIVPIPVDSVNIVAGEFLRAEQAGYERLTIDFLVRSDSRLVNRQLLGTCGDVNLISRCLAP